jgi:hypothetical protein
MHRHYTPPMLAPDYQPFVSHVDGSVINSRSAHREHMARHNLVLHDDVAADLPAKRRAVIEAGFADIKDDVHEAIMKVEQGYKPEVAVATVTESDGIDVVESLPA